MSFHIIDKVINKVYGDILLLDTVKLLDKFFVHLLLQSNLHKTLIVCKIN